MQFFPHSRWTEVCLTQLGGGGVQLLQTTASLFLVEGYYETPEAPLLVMGIISSIT